MGGTRTWRGVVLDDRTADMMDEVLRLVPDCPVWPTQGSYSGGVEASAGTHSGGGAIDIAGEDMSPEQRTELETAMRRVGFAAWVRGPANGFIWHIHGIACDCHDVAPAGEDQEIDYYAGRNGLANNGPDTGTREYVGVTWESYISSAPAPQELEVDMKPYVVNDGNSIWLTDLATYRTWVGHPAIELDGVSMQVFTSFNAGQPVSPAWAEHINKLPRVDK